MRIHPTRFLLAGRRELRGRITAEIFKSDSGRRVLAECLESLARPANSDTYSRRLVLARYADELSITVERRRSWHCAFFESKKAPL
jgi:hypothetical protein